MPQGDNSLDDLGLSTGESSSPGDEISLSDARPLPSGEVKMSDFIVDTYDRVSGELSPDESTTETYQAQFLGVGTYFYAIRDRTANWTWDTGVDGTVLNLGSNDDEADVSWGSVSSDQVTSVEAEFNDPYNGYTPGIQSRTIVIQNVAAVNITGTNSTNTSNSNISGASPAQTESKVDWQVTFTGNSGSTYKVEFDHDSDSGTDGLEDVSPGTNTLPSVSPGTHSSSATYEHTDSTSTVVECTITVTNTSNPSDNDSAKDTQFLPVVN